MTIEAYLRAIGRRGGLATKRRHPEHFREMGRRGALKRWGKRRAPREIATTRGVRGGDG